MEDAEAAEIERALAEKKEQMKTIHQKLIAITEMMIQKTRARETEATTREIGQSENKQKELASQRGKIIQILYVVTV